MPSAGLRPKHFTLVLFALETFGAELRGPRESRWEAIGPFGGTVHIVDISPLQPSRLIAASRGGAVFESTDAARSWRRLRVPSDSNLTIHAALIDRAKPDRYWIGLHDAKQGRGGLLVSSDRGASWRRVPDLEGRSVLSLAIRETEPFWYAAGTDRGVFLSRDLGATWRPVSPPGHPELKAIVSLAFDPRDEEALFAGTTHLPWKTADLGQKWAPVDEGMIDDSDVFSILADWRRPGRVFLSACSGIYSSLDGGSHWRRARGIPDDNRRTHIIAQDRAYPDLVYAGTTAGLWKSADGGGTWKKLQETAVNWLAVDPSDGRVMYMATNGGGVLKTMSAGREFQPSNAGLVARPVPALAAGRGVVYAATSYDGAFGGLFASKDQGTTWTLLANQTVLRGENVQALAIRGDRLVASTYSGALMSADGGKSWVAARRNSNERRLPQIESATTFDSAGAPAKPAIRLAATSAGLYQSANGGRLWKKVTQGLEGAEWFSTVTFHPTRAGESYATQGLTVYRSLDYGDSWERLTPTLPDDIQLNSLIVDSASDMLFAASRDQGVLRFRLPR